MKYKIGVNTKVIGKCDAEKLSYPSAWRVVSATMERLALHISQGHPWMPSVLDEGKPRWQIYANYAELLSIDVDGGLSIEQAISHPFIKKHCSLLIESASSTAELNKFRLVFALKTPLRGWKEIKRANTYLAKLTGYADAQCKDASRFYFGAPGRDAILLQNVTLPDSFASDCRAWAIEQDKALEAARARSARQWEAIQQSGQDTEQMILDALNFIPPDCDYDDWLTIGMSLSTLGDSWLHAWDAWSGQGDKYRAGECGAKWKSFRGSGVGLGSFFHVAKSHGWKFPIKAQQAIDDCQQSQPQETPEEEIPEREKLKSAISELAATIDPYERELTTHRIGSTFSLPVRTVRGLEMHYKSPPVRQFQSLKDIGTKVLQDMAARADSGEMVGTPYGDGESFGELDKWTQGAQPGELTLIAGRTGMGKSAFGLTVAKNMAKTTKKPVAYISLEMISELLYYRLLSTETSISALKLMSGALSWDEWQRVNVAMRYLESVGVKIDDSPGQTAEHIRHKIFELLETHGDLGAIFIDHIGLVDTPSNETRSLELGRVSRTLKQLAMELAKQGLKTPILPLAQINRGVENRTNKRPMSSDLRESGGLEQDAGTIMMLYREEYYDADTPDRGILEIILTKQRMGPPGTIKMLFEPEFSRFRDMPNERLHIA